MKWFSTMQAVVATLAAIGVSAQTTLACEVPWTETAVIEETTTIACDKSWMDLQRRIKIARGFTGPLDFENSDTVIAAEQLIATLNTFDGAAADPSLNHIELAGSLLASDASLRSIARAALLHVAFGKDAVGQYCERLVRFAANGDLARTTETLEMRAIREALQCGTS